MFLLIHGRKHIPLHESYQFTFHNVSINTMALYNNPYQYSLFTFHNVSINTYAVNNGMLTGFKFTFHNVSINTAGAVGNVDYGKNLHSTMFLLIRVMSTRGFLLILNLHSTMFLLIRDTNAWHSDSEFRFTFHNVSINTAERKCRSA